MSTSNLTLKITDLEREDTKSWYEISKEVWGGGGYYSRQLGGRGGGKDGGEQGGGKFF